MLEINKTKYINTPLIRPKCVGTSIPVSIFLKYASPNHDSGEKYIVSINAGINPQLTTKPNNQHI